MKARITSAGHVWLHPKDGTLRVRVDYFPDPGDPLYDGCYVYVPERPLTPEEEAQVGAGETDEEQKAILDQILATIPKVWQTNPINCHMFHLPLGFTADDLDQAMRARMAPLKAKMAQDEDFGYDELQFLPPELRTFTTPEKGPGQALIPTTETEWTPDLVTQAAAILNGKEVSEKVE